MPTLQPVDERIFDTAPSRFERTWTVARPAEAVWAELTGDKPLHWCKGLSATWTSPRPFGVGTTRTATVLGLLTVKEHFFRWEEGRRYTFHATSVNLPLFDTVAEDYLVEPQGADRCTFAWRVALVPSALGKPGAPVNKLLFGRFFADTDRYFAAS